MSFLSLRAGRVIVRAAYLLAVVAALVSSAATARAQSPVKLKATGALVFVPGATSSFVLEGEASHLGKCTGRFAASRPPGITMAISTSYVLNLLVVIAIIAILIG